MEFIGTLQKVGFWYVKVGNNVCIYAEVVGQQGTTAGGTSGSRLHQVSGWSIGVQQRR